MRIAIFDKVHPVLAERLTQAGHTCEIFHDAEIGRGTPSKLDGVIVRSRMLSAELLSQWRDLRFVGRVGAGMENIDRNYCDQHGITVLNAPEGNRDGVGELCVALTLILMKHIIRSNEQVRKGLWSREENRGSDLQGKTVGIIGHGNMGSAFADKLKGFDVRILVHDKYKSGFGSPGIEECPLDLLLAESDVVSLHLPLNDETRYFADAAFFARVKRPIYFLNTSRGAIVDTEALLGAMDEGKVLAAGLDVLEFERNDLSGLDPTIKPGVQQRLFGHERIVLTPHIGGVTHEGARKMAEILARKIIEAFPNDRS